MKNGKSVCIVFLLSTILAISTMASIVSAFPDDAVVEKVFTTYIGDTIAQPPGTPGTDSYNEFIYSGIKWKAGTTVTYSVNMNNAPAGAKEAIGAAFETWDLAVKIELFSDNVGTVSKATGNKYDGVNAISWGRLKPGIIAQTTTWYNRNTKEIMEIGMVFNSGYLWTIGGSSNSFDVQDIATHEAGHTLMLLDLYDDAASALTMYGYGDFGETYARTLGAGDESGIRYIYG
jgi:hypothetical protein